MQHWQLHTPALRDSTHCSTTMLENEGKERRFRAVDLTVKDLLLAVVA